MNTLSAKHFIIGLQRALMCFFPNKAFSNSIDLVNNDTSVTQYCWCVELKEQLLHLLEKEEIFLKSDLCVDYIAKQLHTNRSYVSKVVNEEIGASFPDLVNKYRVRHAQKILLNSNSESLMGEIAKKSGFSNESSFYRIFKCHTGVSPRVYQVTRKNVCLA